MIRYSGWRSPTVVTKEIARGADTGRIRSPEQSHAEILTGEARALLHRLRALIRGFASATGSSHASWQSCSKAVPTFHAMILSSSVVCRALRSRRGSASIPTSDSPVEFLQCLRGRDGGFVGLPCLRAFRYLVLGDSAPMPGMKPDQSQIQPATRRAQMTITFA